jgi:hypothetical protein
MLLLIHVFIALASIAYTSFLLVSPSQSGMRLAKVLVGLTLASGTVLAFSAPAHMLQTCVAGLTYTTIVSTGLVAVRGKLLRVVAR